MGDLPELQITPDTPGKPTIRNPFESPNDYHRLHEALVPSPSVFKSSKTSSATPAKFNWSIDEMSSLIPVHIDPEDIHRQSLYLSQTRMDCDIEEKRQNAIEQFFTKGAIVPSPWAGPASKQSAQVYFAKSSLSPLVFEEPQPMKTKKINAACQTALSLPVDFNLAKMLGEYYRSEEVSEQVQETLSSSSLRRKLFLDGHESGSESSNPPSPERGPPDGPPSPERRPPSLGKPCEERPGDRGGSILSSTVSSPLSCGITALTPSTGQFSSSPIKGGRCRAYSLGSVASPLFPERSSPVGFKSPTLSPIGPHTPIGTGERKKLTFVTPEGVVGVPSDMDVNSCSESPYVEGCSPIRSCSPLLPQAQLPARPRPRTRCWASPPLMSPILQDQDYPPSSPLPPMDLDPCSPSPVRSWPQEGGGRLGEGERPLLQQDCVKMEEGGVEDIPEEEEEEEEEEEGGGGGGGGGVVCPVRLTSSRVGSVSAAENSHMFVSLLVEGSTIPYDCSMQVDSGYNTYSMGTASLIDGLSSDKESFNTHLPEEAYASRHTTTKAKIIFPHH